MGDSETGRQGDGRQQHRDTERWELEDREIGRQGDERRGDRDTEIWETGDRKMGERETGDREQS